MLGPGSRIHLELFQLDTVAEASKTISFLKFRAKFVDSIHWISLSLASLCVFEYRFCMVINDILLKSECLIEGLFLAFSKS